MSRTEIAPGVFVTTLPGEKFKRSLITLHLVVPGKREEATDLALLPHILERRCAAIPDPTLLARRLSGLYGADLASESYAAGAARVLSIGISGLKNEYALAGEDLTQEYLDLLCGMLFAPKMTDGLFEAEDIEIEKEKQADYLRSEMNDKRSRCLRQARRKLFGDSPLGVESAGYLEDLPAVTPASITAAYHTLLQNATVEISVCGAEEAVVSTTLATYFNAIERTPQEATVRGAAQPIADFPHFEEPMDTAQGKLCILCTSGQIADVRGSAVMRVAGALLGGLPSSRLFLNVREKQGLCYYCSSNYDSLKNIMTIDSGVDHPNAERAANAILHELETLQKDLVTEQELAFAHLALQNAFSSARDNPDALAGWVFSEHLRGSNLTLDEAAALIASVTREEVRDALASLQPSVQYVITGKADAQGGDV